MHIPLASFNLDQQEGRDKTETVTLVSLLTGDGGMKMQQPCNYWTGTGEIPLGPETYWIQLSLIILERSACLQAREAIEPPSLEMFRLEKSFVKSGIDAIDLTWGRMDKLNEVTSSLMISLISIIWTIIHTLGNKDSHWPSSACSVWQQGDWEVSLQPKGAWKGELQLPEGQLQTRVNLFSVNKWW